MGLVSTLGDRRGQRRPRHPTQILVLLGIRMGRASLPAPALRRAGFMPRLYRILAMLTLGSISTGAFGLGCPGDCDRDDLVRTTELVVGVRVLLGAVSIASCTALDRSGDQRATIDELLAAVEASLDGCSAAAATATATPATPVVTPTPTVRAIITPFWEALAPLPAAQQEAGVAELNSRVYVIGGFGRDGRPTDAVWVYDVAEDEWTSAKPLPAPLHHVAAVALGGRVYAIGGLTGQFFASVKSLSAYEPDTDSWAPLAALPRERGAAAAAVIDGLIYVAGGFNAGSVDDFAVYDPAANEWTGLAAMPTARDHLAAAAIDGVFYAVGGRDGGALYATLEAYDPISGEWDTTRAPMPTARGGLAGAAFNGRLFTFGGEGNGNDPKGIFPQTEVYDPANNGWMTLPPMRTPRHGLGAVAVGDRIILPGGATRAGFEASAANDAFHPGIW